MKDIRRVAIAGAGTMGYSLAQAFSAAGYPVKLYDLFPAALDKARDMIALNQQTEVTSGKLTAEQSAALIGRISLTSQLEDLANTDFLVEAILEKLEVKHDFYRQLCAVVAEDAILCSKYLRIEHHQNSRGRHPSGAVRRNALDESTPYYSPH